MFGSTYLCEELLSLMNRKKTGPKYQDEQTQFFLSVMRVA